MRAVRAIAHRGAAATRCARRNFLVELERDAVRPQLLFDYSAAIAEHATRRAEVDQGYLGSFGVDVGRVSSLYHLSLFDDYDARDAREQQSDLRVPDGVLLEYEDTPEGDPVASRIEGALLSTETSVFAEATATLEAAGLPGLAGGIDLSETAVYELRTYELVLGYATVPKFLELYGPGLVDKLAVDDSGESKLLSLLHSEAGVAPLNTVVELWRHESAQGAQRSRVASRGATTWRKAIGDIAEIATRFETQLLRPCVMMKHVE